MRRTIITVLLMILAFCVGSWASTPKLVGYNCDGGNVYEPLYADSESAFPFCERIERL